MRILYAVQRYGASIVGGSEAAARAFAERLAAGGHDVHVATSCAQSYVDWADVYPSGTTQLNGVTVHRFPVAGLRLPERFGPLHDWAMHGPRPMPYFQQQRWAKHMGPDIIGYQSWLARHLTDFDLAVFMTYMYTTTTLGLPMASGVVPTVLQPTAHDEPPIWVNLYDTLFRLPDAYLFFTPEERETVKRRFRLEPTGDTIGIGIDLVPPGDAAALRSTLDLGADPYLLYVGRIDAIKGSREMFDFFCEYKRRRPGPLKLLFVGERISSTGDHPDVMHTGFLDEAAKHAAMAGAVALVQPSRFESFSIVLCESWAQRRPALVHGDCDVLVGQARRSGGALPYRGFAEFEAAVDLLLDRPDLANRMGLAGHRYVSDNYRWEHVIDRFLDVATVAGERFAARSRHGAIGGSR